METIEEMMERLINEVDEFTEEESKEVLKGLKKFENIGPSVEEYFGLKHKNMEYINIIDAEKLLKKYGFEITKYFAERDWGSSKMSKNYKGKSKDGEDTNITLTFMADFDNYPQLKEDGEQEYYPKKEGKYIYLIGCLADSKFHYGCMPDGIELDRTKIDMFEDALKAIYDPMFHVMKIYEKSLENMKYIKKRYLETLNKSGYKFVFNSATMKCNNIDCTQDILFLNNKNKKLIMATDGISGDLLFKVPYTQFLYNITKKQVIYKKGDKCSIDYDEHYEPIAMEVSELNEEDIFDIIKGIKTI